MFSPWTLIITYREEQTIRKGRQLKDLSLAEMDAIWDEAKEKGM